jgi:hypothetical protein
LPALCLGVSVVLIFFVRLRGLRVFVMGPPQASESAGITR